MIFRKINIDRLQSKKFKNLKRVGKRIYLTNLIAQRNKPMNIEVNLKLIRESKWSMINLREKKRKIVLKGQKE